MMYCWFVSKKKQWIWKECCFCVWGLYLKKVVGHVSFNWSKLAAKFLQCPNRRIRIVVTGKRVNRSADFGLEILVDYIFYGGSRVTTWLKKALEKLDGNSLNIKVQTCVNKTFENEIVYFIFLQEIWVFRY